MTKARTIASITVVAVVLACVTVWLVWPSYIAARKGALTGSAGSGRLEPFRTPGGTLHTNGIVKTEELRKETESWRGTTSSIIRLDATYRYDIELRADWNIHIDDARKLALVIAPPYKPQLPVGVDSRSIEERTSSGWGRFDKWEHLQALRKEISPYLASKANSRSYLDLARGDARRTVEEFASDWLTRNGRLPADANYVVKVYFADEDNIPLPRNTTLKDFLP